jgi:SynChlorMet cassette radical SAM/SPASM protein ScmF
MGCEPELLQKKGKPAKARKLNLPKGVPPLTSLYMYISGSCNLACHHCWIEPDFQTDNKKGKFLKLEYLKKAIKEAKPLGLQSVKLTGGEPMLHPQFREIVEHIESKKIGMIMETNGTLIDDKMAAFLKSKKYFNFVSVSIDGAKPETHDNLRGIKGSFKKAVAGIKSLVKAGFHPQLICTLHKGNIAELEDVVKLAESLGCGSVKFNHVQHMGRGDAFARKSGFEVQELIKLFQMIESKIKPKSKIKIFFDIPVAFYSIKKILKESICRCMIFNILGITSQGNMALCGIGETIPKLNYGNLDVNSIKEIWLGKKELIELRKNIPNKFEGICAKCMHKWVCLGSCIANNFHLKNKFISSYYFCDNAFHMGLFPKTRIIS